MICDVRNSEVRISVRKKNVFFQTEKKTSEKNDKKRLKTFLSFFSKLIKNLENKDYIVI